MRPTIDPAAAARRIIDALRETGHTALLAGGCVRDRLLGKDPKDYDVATDAPPERVAEIFPRSRKVGAKFGVVLVRVGGHDVEVATFRRDGTYTDGRRPDSVVFGSDVEDAQRRDFTINGMFYDPVADRVIDHVGGQEDLRRRVIRTIGDPGQRFGEDHLRLLRAIRFAARLGFDIEPATFEAIRRHAHELAGISAERIWMELEQILAGGARAHGWRLILDSELRPWLCESWPADAAEDRLGLARLERLPATALPVHLPTAGLLAGLPPTAIRRIAADLRWSNRLREDVSWLVRSLATMAHERPGAQMELADFKRFMASPLWEDMLLLLQADEGARGANDGAFVRVVARAAAIPPDRVAPPPLLTGDELAAAGYAAGPQIGRMLDAVRRAQLNEHIHTREEALKLAKTLRATQ